MSSAFVRRAQAALAKHHRILKAYSTAPLPAQQPWGPPPPGTKVFAAMSGGVDSSVTARMLLEQGYDVAPVFMRNWDTLDEASESGGCEWERDWEAVQRICRESLGGVQPELVDLSKEYWNAVFQEALDDWAAGVTPNPDVNCNQQIKFRELPDRLFNKDPNAWLATGHYARLLPSPLDPSLPALHRASFLPKDQSYYLSTSPISALSRTLFPLGDLTKDAVRDLARKWDLHTAERKESMGICFVGVRNRFGNFLDSYLEPKPGNIEDASGRVVGQHGGLWRYTIGEGARLGGFPTKMYVGRKDVERNAVVIVPGDSPLLRVTRLSTKDFIWSAPHHPPAEVDSKEGFIVSAQTRSLQAGALSKCTVRRLSDGSLSVELLEPIKGVSPGQAVVLYDGTWCLGGGTISSTQTMADDVEVGERS